jgi:hypothetical protein
MDLQALADRTRIPVRRLRHCLDQNLIPGLKVEIAENLAGRPRRFNEDVGFAIACAATLIEAGVLRSTVRVFMSGLALVKLPDNEVPVVLSLFQHQTAGIASLGDNVNMRIQLEFKGKSIDTGWVHPGNPADLDRDYRPLTMITLDIGEVGRRTFGWSRGPKLL